MLVIEGAVPEQQPFGGHLAGQKLLGKRRPLVRQHLFIAHKNQTSCKSFTAQCVDRLRARLSAAHDEDRRNHDAMLADSRGPACD